MLNIGQLILVNSRNHPDRMAIVSNTRSLTYQELNRESNLIANALTRRGIKKGDSAGILMKNSVEWIIAWFACQKLGVIFVPLHVRLKADELIESMQLAKCKVIFFGESFHEKAETICNSYRDLKIKVCVGAVDSTYPFSAGYSISWDSLLKEGDEKEAQVELNNEDPAVLLYTSGTVGRPKGVLRTQEQVVLHGITLALRNNSSKVIDVMMSTAPLYHIGGLQGYLKMLILGGTYITLERILPEEVMYMIERWKVTQLQMLPPVTYERLYRDPCWKKTDCSSVWEVCISAGKCTTDYIDHVFEMFPKAHLRPSWGSTETCSVTCAQIEKEDYYKDTTLVNTTGTVMPLTEVRIIDSDGKDVEPGQPGEAIVKSPMVFYGYMNQQEIEEEELFVDGKWFRTGDIMMMDPKTRMYYFKDRKKDIVKTGGENVYALEVERAIQEHPQIRDCAVIGVPDERFGEGIAAAVVLQDDRELDIKEFIEFCKSKLPSFKKPRYLAILDALPVNDIGKTAKNVLRQQSDQLFFPIFNK